MVLMSWAAKRHGTFMSEVPQPGVLLLTWIPLMACLMCDGLHSQWNAPSSLPGARERLMGRAAAGSLAAGKGPSKVVPVVDNTLQSSVD